MAEKLFAEFPPVSTQEWEEVITRDLKGADYAKKLIWKTGEGFEVRPYYRAEDLKGIEHLGTMPGEFPYVRGTKENNHWLVRQDFCVCEGYDKANAHALDALMKGADSIGFVMKGAVSEGEMATLLEGIELPAVEINFVSLCTEAPETISRFLSYVASKGYDKDRIRASFDFDPIRTLNTKGYFCNDKVFETAAECIRLVKDYKGIRVIGVRPYVFNDAGASITQELGFGLAMGVEYLDRLTDLGIAADEAARRMKFTFAVSSNYFLEIAKFRAARMLWANIVKDYGVECCCAMKMNIHAVTSAWNQTVYDAYVNMLRDTTEAMSATIAGVDSLEVLPFDHAFAKPDEFSSHIARNVQNLLKEESHFDKVEDPAAGSYYIENLTASIAKVAWDLFKKTIDAGGYVEAFKAGMVQGEIKTVAADRDKKFETRRATILGTNQYPNFLEKISDNITLDIVKRGAVKPEINKPQIAEPLEKYRAAQPFEELRYSTDKSGKQPMAFMLTFGNLAMCRARAQFACNFFAVAGFKVVDNNRFADIEEGVKAAIEAKADIVVACSSDEEYPEAVPQIAEKLGNKALLVVAGGENEELIAKGITHFINVKCNVLETLRMYQEKMGIKEL